MNPQVELKQAIYIEIADKIEKFIKLNVYRENEKLPSCRELALQLGVNPNTISRAYCLLEERGEVFTIPKKGIFVKPKKPVESEIDASVIVNFFKLLKEENIKKEKIQKILEEVYEDIEV